MSNELYFEICVVNFNKIAYLKNCVNSILNYTKHSQYKIFVVDNGSDDGSKEWLVKMSERHPEKIFPILFEENVGFIEANNFVADKILEGNKPFDDIRYMVLINNDFTFLEPWDEKVTSKFSTNPNLAIVGMNSPVGELDSSGNGKTIVKRRDYVEGFFMVIRTDIIEKYGLFNKNMTIAYCEDSDLCLRYRERGYDIDVVHLKFAHPRAITSRSLRRDKKLDLDGAQKRNTAILRDNWSWYMDNEGSFERNYVFKRSTASGDVLLMTPLFRAIKEEFPYSTLWLHTFPIRRAVVSHCRYVDHVITKEKFDFTKIKPVDYVDLDLSYEKNPRMHICDAYLKTICETIPKFECLKDYDLDYRPEIELLNSEVKDAENRLYKLKKPVITLDISDSWESRMLPSKVLLELANVLMESGFAVVKLGKCYKQTGRLSVPCHLDLAQRLNIRETMAVISMGDIHIGPDNLWMHVAYAFKKPLISWFGCINPRYRINVDDPKVGIIYKDNLKCIGCHHWRKYPRVSTDCIRRNIECMDSITVKDIMDKMKEVFEKSRKEG